MVLDGTEDFVDGQGEVLFRSEGSEWIWRENRECLLLEGGLPRILVINMGQSLALWVCLLPVITLLERVADDQPTPTECKAALRTGPRSFVLRHVSTGVCIGGERSAVY